MSVRHHDHPESPGGIRPEDLDLYALDALPEQEADAVEEALVAATAEQRASMLAHIRSTREVAVDLVTDAQLDVPPPAALRARVLEQAAADKRRGAADRDTAWTGTPQPDEEAGRGGGTVVDLSGVRGRRRPGPLMYLVSAAAAVVLLAAGVAIGRLSDGTDPEANLPVAAPPSASMPQKVSSLLNAPDLEVAQGRVAGTGNATVLASKAADMAVISMTGLPEPAEGRAYQLWLMGPDHPPISAGTMEAGQVGPSPSAQLDGIRDSAQIGITVEPAGGSPAPTGEVLLALDID